MNAKLRIINIEPASKGFFQEIIRTNVIINEGTKWIKKPSNFSIAGDSPENESNAKNDKSKINTIVSTLGIQNNLCVFIQSSINLDLIYQTAARITNIASNLLFAKS